MRRTLLLVIGLLWLAAAPAATADTGVDVGGFAFAPADVTVAAGDTVTWKFNGPETNHSVTAKPGQADTFDSDPATSSPNHAIGDTFAHRFDTPGVFSYVCKVHSFMTGKVTVTGAGGEVPDTTAPTFASLKGKLKGTTLSLSFRLDEPAAVAGSLKLVKASGKHGKTSRAVKGNGKSGANVLKVSTKGLRAGRYKATLRATDTAGNRSTPATVTLTVP
jgi:plastocyanin